MSCRFALPFINKQQQTRERMAIPIQHRLNSKLLCLVMDAASGKYLPLLFLLSAPFLAASLSLSLSLSWVPDAQTSPRILGVLDSLWSFRAHGTFSPLKSLCTIISLLSALSMATKCPLSGHYHYITTNPLRTSLWASHHQSFSRPRLLDATKAYG